MHRSYPRWKSWKPPKPKELELKEKRTVITEDMLRELLSRFKSFVAEKNTPEIKKFIQHYVEKVIVHEEHVDVIFKLDIVGTFGGGEGSIETFYPYDEPFCR